MRIRYSLFAGLILLLMIVALPLMAQDSRLVSDDQVNAIAEKMYCPICENIPLDVCETTTCYQWREEIRLQIAEGKSEDEIMTGFVERFGDRVLGAPQDPILRALSLVTPWILILLIVVVGVFTFLRWRTHEKLQMTKAPDAPVGSPDLKAGSEAAYRQRLEDDLRKRR